jgi:hypothetical protein
MHLCSLSGRDFVQVRLHLVEVGKMPISIFLLDHSVLTRRWEGRIWGRLGWESGCLRYLW